MDVVIGKLAGVRKLRGWGEGFEVVLEGDGKSKVYYRVSGDPHENHATFEKLKAARGKDVRVEYQRERSFNLMDRLVGLHWGMPWREYSDVISAETLEDWEGRFKGSYI